jgi:molybdopterin synthase catalytic subunit
VSHPAVRLVDIRDTPLEVDEVVKVLDGPADSVSGGLNMFIGRVRDHDHDKGVTGLTYDAHPSALDRLTEICERVADEFGVNGVAAVHRTGDLAIGDIAVIVATTAGHRGEAYEASRALIDTLKAEVPIWKHQRFTDGTDEWVGAP